MDFTREPIIETVITPKEGCKIVVRSSKSSGQEEYFVDAVEVVSFGSSLFFRSMERPKAFLVPVSDYEILEVREARMVLKNVGIDRAIKIGGGRDAQMRAPREQTDRSDKTEKQEKVQIPLAEGVEAGQATEAKPPEKKRDRRRQYRRRRGRDGAAVEEEDLEEENKENSAAKIELTEPRTVVEGEAVPMNPIPTPSVLTSLLPPPPTLISETIARYKDNALFRDAFYSKADEKLEEMHIQESEEREVFKDNIPSVDETIPLIQPAYGTFEVSEQEEEEIYQQRKRRSRQPVVAPVAEGQESHAEYPPENKEQNPDNLSMDRPEENTPSAAEEAPINVLPPQEPQQ